MHRVSIVQSRRQPADLVPADGAASVRPCALDNMLVAHEPEPESYPELVSQLEPQPQPDTGTAKAQNHQCATERSQDLVDEAIESHLRRSRVALDKGDAEAQQRALSCLARARDLARSQARLGQGRPELHALALLRFVEEISASSEAAVAGADVGITDTQSLVALCEEALTRLAASGETSPMLEGRCLRELSQLLFELPPEHMDRAAMDRATEARRTSKRLIAEAEAQLAALQAIHDLESKPCDVVPEEFGFKPAEQTLVRLVAQSGVSDWNSIAAKMSEADDTWSATKVQELWTMIVEPRVREMLESNPTMGCGHSCSDCPTKDTCRLHDSLELPDVEDL